MSISKYNNEGYPDPTAFGALSSIENETRALRAFRPIVYICSPFAGDIEKNVVAARTYSSRARMHSHRTTPAVSTVFERQRPERT